MKFTLRPYQQTIKDDLRRAFREGSKSLLLVSPTASGKCLGKGTPVLMYDGTVLPVEKIRPGDKLMGPDSNLRTVLSVCSGQEMLYRIKPNKGESFVVNESHILSLKRTREDSKINNTEKLYSIEVGDYINQTKWFKHIHKLWRNGVDFPPNLYELPLLEPYFLGIWLGDGSSRIPSITTGDREIVQYLEEYANRIDIAIRKELNSENSEIIHLIDKHRPGRGGSVLMNAMKHYNLIQNKHIPLRYKTGSRQERLELLAGIIDTDGHKGKREDYELTLKNEHLLDDVIFIARSLGFAAYKTPIVKTCCNNGKKGTYFRCHINGPLEIIPCKIPRKISSYHQRTRNPLITGLSVEPIGIGDYYGFHIAGPDRLFMLGDFTVTHNTIMFASITEGAAARGNRVMILVHRQELLNQCSMALEEIGVPHGLIAPGRTQTYDLVQVASVQTLVRRLDRVPRPNLLILDEAHHAPAGSFSKIIDHYRSARLLGVTATPVRLDGRGLGIHAGGYFDRLVKGPTVRELIDLGYLSRPIVYAPPIGADLKGLHHRFGDFVAKEAAGILDKPTITGNAVAHYLRICPGVPAIAFCTSVEHAEHTAERFRNAGVPSESIDGTLDDRTRRHRIESLADGRIKVLTSCEIISEGTDIPVVTAAILLRPTESLGLCLQQMGRAMRIHPSKKNTIILDHVGNVFRHGMPDDDREWSLYGEAGEKRRKADPTVVENVQCERCYLVFPAWLAQCPSCGWVRENGRKVEEIEGELQEVQRIEQEMRDRFTRRREIFAANTYEKLLLLADKLGYKKGWAWHLWQHRIARSGKCSKDTNSESATRSQMANVME